MLDSVLIHSICSTIPNYKVEVLGSNTLADLRDALMCENDFVYLKELQHPDEEQDMDDLAKVLIPIYVFIIL